MSYKPPYTNIDLSRIGERAMDRREELRDIPNAVSGALELARAMFVETDLVGAPEWCTDNRIDQVIACAAYAAEHLADTVSKVIGEDDRGLETIEIYVYGDDAETLRRVTPEGQDPAHYCRDLLEVWARGKSEEGGE